MYFELIIFTLQNYRHSPTYKTTQNSHFYVRMQVFISDNGLSRRLETNKPFSKQKQNQRENADFVCCLQEKLLYRFTPVLSCNLSCNLSRNLSRNLFRNLSRNLFRNYYSFSFNMDFTIHIPFLLEPSRTITSFSWKYLRYSLIVRSPIPVSLDN